MIEYGIVKELDLDIEEALKRVEVVLKEEGFGIVSRVDMDEKFKDKLNIDFKRYIILGACSPRDAYKAVSTEENIGLLLPCNVIIYDNGSGTTVGVINPSVAMSSVKNEELAPIAIEIEGRLNRVLENI